MEKIAIVICSLLLVGSVQAQNGTSPSENYIQSRVYLEAVTTTSPDARQINTVQYFDGLGRPKQVVNVKASPLGRDVVSQIEYDSFGRQVKDYLPVPQEGTLNGAIVPTPLANASNTLLATEKIYTEKILENSPLDRILQQKQVGTAWNDKPVNFNYDAATVADAVKKFTTSTTWENGATKSIPSNTGLYQNNQLYKNTVTDEDGNKTIEFKNARGRLILARKVVSASENADTYYVYNDYDQLAFVVPPLLAKIQSWSQADQDNLAYQYRYDERSRLVEKKLPGKGWEAMVYDKSDRLILSQDANLKTQNKWLITKYDQLGRVAYIGFLTTGGERAGRQNEINNLVITESRNPTGFTRNGMAVYYTDNYFIGEIPTILSVNYYDTYPSYSFNPAFPGSVQGEPVLTDNGTGTGKSTKGLPVMSLVKNIEDDNWTKNYIYYDTKGRSVGSYSINHLGGYTKTESQLDFAGAVMKAVTKHKRLDTDTERVITENFTYDGQNRLLVHKHQVDSNPEEILTQNKYNELSQLESKKVGGIDPGSPLQTIDYKYNIRGWMTQINDPVTLNGKLFGYKIKYNNPEYTSIAPGRFNGNIAEIDWNMSTVNNIKRYNYTYDRLNRLTDAEYAEPEKTNPHNKKFDERLSYDLNGNIAFLKRNTIPVFGETSTQVDDLEYKYTGNRLNQVIESSLNDTGYEGGNNTIDYDLNGNMINMKDKGIQNIVYNYLSLPNNLSITLPDPFGVGQNSNANLAYLYRADGVKLRKSYLWYGRRGSSGSARVTDYLDGFQYSYFEGGGPCLTCRAETAYEEQAYKNINDFPGIGGPPEWKLDFVPTAEGFYSFTENRYIYQYRDHLGNARVSFAKDSEGVLEVTNTNNYYPFGLNHIEGMLSTSNFGSYYSYKYNGKELQETGMFDYGARFYMPDIGRWGVIDPRSQYTHETYSYVWNNPISFADPTGMTPESVADWITDGKGSYIWNPAVTRESNIPEGWKYVGPTGSYRVDGATVQLLEGGNKFTDIDEVAVSGSNYTPALAAGAITSTQGAGLFILLAVALKIAIDDLVGVTPIYQGIHIDPMMHSPHTMNSESDSGDDKDVNGVDVPKEKKVPVSGKTGKEASKEVPSWVKEKGEAPNVDEDGKTFAKRVLDEHHGKGKWNNSKKDTGPTSDYNKIKKWGDRGFEIKPKK